MSLQEKLANSHTLAGTFVKTPSSEVIEILALAGLDFICLDAEHSPMGRRELDWSIALARALRLPALVRISHAAPEAILQALDCGASAIVVPHVSNLSKAREVARWARFGANGRGYAGSTRAAGFTTQTMPDVIASGGKCFVIAQIEDPEALDEIDAIAALDGIDGLFFGAADMAVGLGLTNSAGPQIDEAFARVAEAAARAKKPLAAYCAAPSGIAALAEKGVKLAFVGSDQGMVLSGGKAISTAARHSLSK